MNGAALLANPHEGLAFAAAELVRSLPSLGGVEALNLAVEEFRRRGVEPMIPAIQRARIIARDAARERNERLRQDSLSESARDAAELERLREVWRRAAGMPAGPQPIEPTPYVWTNPARLPRRQWLYGRHLIRGEVSLTLAPGGVGKTSLAAVEVAAMASGRALLHDHPERPLRVWWWNGEEPEDEMARRLAAVVKHYRLPPSALADRLFIDNGHILPLVLAEQTKEGTCISAPVVERLVDALRSRRTTFTKTIIPQSNKRRRLGKWWRNGPGLPSGLPIIPESPMATPSRRRTAGAATRSCQRCATPAH